MTPEQLDEIRHRALNWQPNGWQYRAKLSFAIDDIQALVIHADEQHQRIAALEHDLERTTHERDACHDSDYKNALRAQELESVMRELMIDDEDPRFIGRSETYCPFCGKGQPHVKSMEEALLVPEFEHDPACPWLKAKQLTKPLP